MRQYKVSTLLFNLLFRYRFRYLFVIVFVTVFVIFSNASSPYPFLFCLPSP